MTTESNIKYSKTTKEAVDKWDNGDVVWTIEMGGLGPGYEQAIQIVVMELLRRHHDYKFEDSEWENNRDMLYKAISSIDNNFKLGLSGAQGAAACSLAVAFITKGWKEVMESVDEDRHIMITKHWPKT